MRGMNLRRLGMMALIGCFSLLSHYPTSYGNERRPFIAELRWEKRSDWMDVRDFGAKGDGRTDDTEAIQKALDAMEYGSTLFFPPGAYVITRTLILHSSGQRIIGGALIGCGKSTRIVWDGPADPGIPMLLIKSGMCHIGRYIGIVWDGRGKAGVGIEHRSDNFETEVLHFNEAFLNFTNSGIKIGAGVQQSAEMRIENCLFENCETGIAYLNFNDYDITINGCEFRECGVGIRDNHGNGYIRNCRFLNSKIADLQLHSEHGSSIRRCISHGSHTFLIYTSIVAPLVIQQCHISGWKNPDGAIVLGNNAPILIMDTTFSEPPNTNPPIDAKGKTIILSGNRFRENRDKIVGGDTSSVIEIPPGKEKVKEIPLDISFLKENIAIPRKVFDARVHFGAKGDGRTDDTEAIQRTIDTARRYGRNCIAYIPKGTYLVSKTIEITGSNYHVSGCGTGTNILWKGEEGGTVFHIKSPENIVVENLRIGWDIPKSQLREGIDILQTSTPGKKSFILYEGICVYGMYQNDPGRGGLHLVNLSKDDRVVINHLCGNLTLRNCGNARILVNQSYNGNLIVEGKEKERKGFIGFLNRFTPDKPFTLYVKDNQSLVIGDYYVEQCEGVAYIEGEPDAPAGKIVIQGAKFHWWEREPPIVPILIKNYKGLIMMAPEQFYSIPATPLISFSGRNDCDLIFLGAMWYPSTPPEENFKVASEPSAIPPRLYSIGCKVSGWDETTTREKFERLFNKLEKRVLEKVAEGLDELRRLGNMDLEFNHPDVWRVMNRP